MKKILKSTLFVMAAAMFVYTAFAAIYVEPSGTDTFPDGTKVFREVVDEDYHGTLIPRELRREIQTKDNLLLEKESLERDQARITTRLAEIDWMLARFPE